jgi:hypothetical protein
MYTVADVYALGGTRSESEEMRELRRGGAILGMMLSPRSALDQWEDMLHADNVCRGHSGLS